MRTYLASALMLLLAFAVMIQPVGALSVISIPFTSIGCATFMDPLSFSSVTIEEFNSASIFANDTENLDIGFPLSNGGGQVIPFGAVNIATPSIVQATNQTLGTQRTYFFTDTF